MNDCLRLCSPFRMVPNCVIRLCLVEVLTKALTVESMAKVDYSEGYEMV